MDRVLSWLEGQGGLQPGMEVLDISTGTGVFTLPLDRRAGRVTALEPAPANAWLKEQVPPAGRVPRCRVSV
ncbi:MAG: hypothetical protein AB1374_07425 [Bacillota bacterium]